MATRTCHRCGAPAGASSAPEDRLVLCCAGCLLAHQVPVDEKGNFPVNAALIAGLVTGFIYFNQLLLWALAGILAGQGRAETAALCGLASLGAGAVVWLAAGRAQRHAAGGIRPVDAAVAGFAALMLAMGVALRAPSLGAIANAVLLAWDFRGLLKKKTVRKP